MSWAEIDQFLRSPSAARMWELLTTVLFWFSLLITPVVVVLFWKMASEYERKKKRLAKDLHSPGMEDVRHFLKPLCKKLGIEIDDKPHERN